MKKKCLTCDKEIWGLDKYVCYDCYNDIQIIKKEFISLDQSTLKSEYYRWRRNQYLARNITYKNEYQKKTVAIAEIMNEKYGEKSFIIKIIDFSNGTIQTEEELEVITKKSETYFEDDFEKENAEPNIDSSKYHARLKCKDGHRVISKSERAIDDLLDSLKIRHSYDTNIDNYTEYRCDFKLLDYENIFIEHWGYKNKKNYLQRKIIKKEYYASKGYVLIESEEDDIDDLSKMTKKLRNAGVKV